MFIVLQIFVTKTSNSLVSFFNCLVFFLFTFFYTYTFLINPGYPKKDWDVIEGGKRKKYCGVCKMWVPKNGTVHCEDCDICIEGYDHHCPWTSKCIGKRNMWSFIGFLVMVFVVVFYFTFAMAFTAETLSKQTKKK